MKVIRPTKTKITRGYFDYHKGYDFSGRTPVDGLEFDDGVYASFDGQVVLSVNKYDSAWRNTGTLTTADYGNFFKLKGDNLFQLSAHLQKDTVPPVGATFKKGDRIATIGNTGNSTGRHCHTEYRFLNGINTPVEFDIISSEPIAHDLEQNAIDYLISKGYKTEGDIRALVATVDEYQRLQVDHANLITKYENALAEFKIEKNKLNALAEGRKQELDQRARELADIYQTTQEWSKIISEAKEHIDTEDRLRDCQKALESAREGIPLRSPGLLETFIAFLTSLIEYNKRITKLN